MSDLSFNFDETHDLSFDFDETHDLSVACQDYFQAPDDLADAMVGAAGAALDSDAEERPPPPPPKPSSSSEMPWAELLAEEGVAPDVTAVPVVPVTPVVPVVAAVLVKAGNTNKLKRKLTARDWTGFAGASVRWDTVIEKWCARLSIEDTCKQRVVGHFDTMEEARAAFVTALGDVDAFMAHKKKGRKKGGKNRSTQMKLRSQAICEGSFEL